jgi:ribosomal protein S18 acetylase RimI-like enzyme
MTTRERAERFSVRRAIIGDEPILRDLRLQAMTDSPEAFGSTYERELARTTLDWQRWLAPGVTFLLEQAGRGVGIVAGQPDPTDPHIVHLMAMWVHPEARGSGAADSLVTALIGWAAAQGATLVCLDVIKSNTRATRFYERHRFRPSGVERRRENDGRIEVRMQLTIG